MGFLHNNIEYTIPDEWWNEAGMKMFKPKRRSYRSRPSPHSELRLFEVAITDVQPLDRTGSHGVFNDAGAGRREGTARERVLRVLTWFQADSPVEPVCVSQTGGEGKYPFRLTQGAHRFYCAVASGFSHVPAVEEDLA